MSSFRITRLLGALGFLLFFGAPEWKANATELSTRLSETEVKKAADILGFGSIHRNWTAHSIPGGSLGLDLGVESTFLFRSDLTTQGDGTGVVPRMIPVPRLWLSWDLPKDFMVSGSFAPGMTFDGITAVGLSGQWTFERITEWAMSSSVVGSYTFASAFGDLTTQNFGADIQISRDLTFWQPYALLGLNVMVAQAQSRIVASGVRTGNYWRWAHHLAVGFRLDFMAKLSVQIDLNNFRPSTALLLSTSF